MPISTTSQRSFFDGLYTYRIELAIGSALVAVAVLAVVAGDWAGSRPRDGIRREPACSS